MQRLRYYQIVGLKRPLIIDTFSHFEKRKKISCYYVSNLAKSLLYLVSTSSLSKNKIILKRKLNIFHYSKTLIQEVIHVFLIQVHILTESFSTIFGR